MNDIQHSGVLGMKWGKHKTKNENQPATKSKHRSSLEEKYKKEGMSEKDAVSAANKRIKTEKAIAVVAGLTIAAATTYIAVNHYQNNVDKIIKSGKTLQNISTDSNKGVEQAFYASMNNRDNTKYRGIYGQQLQGRNPFGNLRPNDIYETKIKTTDSLKIASKENSKKALQELFNNDDTFKQQVIEKLKTSEGVNSKQKNMIKKGLAEINSGKIGNKSYELFNYSLTDHNAPHAEEVSKKFFDIMKSKGYSGIQDINDLKLSGYNTKTPVILFGNSKSLKVDKIRKLGEQEIRKNAMKAYADLMITNEVKKGAVASTAIIAGLSANNYINNDQLK